MKETKAQVRLKNVIQYIKSNPSCNTCDIAEKLNTTERTIQSDLKYLRDKWKDGTLTSKQGKHTIVLSKALSKKGIEAKEKIFIKLALESLENLTDLSAEYNSIVKELNLHTLQNPYYIKPDEYESLNSNEEEIKHLDGAINRDEIIEFTFREKYYHVEPYRLVNFDGIWYLYGRDIEEKVDNDHKTWLLKEIDDVEVYYGQKHDTSDAEIDEDLDNAYSAAFVVDKSFEVKLKVSAKVAKRFRQKNHLPKQNSVIQEDGSLLVISTISTYADIDPEVKSWLPHIEVLEPLEYKKSFEEELKRYVQSI